MSAPPPLSVGSTFGAYRIDAILDRGGMGVVYAAQDQRLGRRVALKLLSENLAADAQFRDRFLRESRLAAAIEHPGVVPIYEAGEVDGQLYMTMRYVEGRDLARVLSGEGAIAPERAVELVGQLADALDAAHARGLIHRDVKPSNALVGQERDGERAYLVDFGITQDLGSAEKVTETGAMVGTVDYLAPERIRGEAIDLRADVYSLGCVLFECLTGEVPFTGTNELARIYAHLEHEPPRLGDRRPGLPPALDAVVRRALAKDPGDRWQTCGELAQAARAAIAPGGPRERPAAPAAAGSRRRAVMIGGAVAALAAGAAAVALTGAGGDDTAPTAPSGGQVVTIDAATGRISGRAAAGRTPTALALDRHRRLWMIDAEARTLLRLDLDSGAVATTATGATPVDVATGRTGIWVANGRRANDFGLGPVLDEVVRLDAASQRQRARVVVPSSGELVDSQGVDNQLATTAGAVWTLTAEGAVLRIDERTAAIAGSSGRIRARAVAAGPAGVWAGAGENSLVALDPRTAKVGRRVRVPGGLDGLAVGDTAAWATAAADGKLWRVARDPASVPGSVDVGSGVTDVVTTREAVWVANPSAGTVTQVDPEGMRVVRVLEIGGTPRSLATDGRTVWVAATGTVAVAQRGAAGVRPLPSATCDPVVAGNGGRADLLVASDLPLQGDSRLQTSQMAQAMLFVLRERRFRAGRFRVAYQSCDDALPATGSYDDARCASNGRAYARNPDVVAILGTFNSGCAGSLIPELNRARGGPVPMISPLNSYVGLTREADEPGLLGELYPTGRRNFVRVYPTDDAMGPALAEFARDRGHRRVFAIEDDTVGYSELIVDAFARRAAQLGLKVVGRGRWDPARRSYAGLARSVRAANARAVLVSGLLPNNGARLVRDLRAVLGRRVDLLAPDGFAPASTLTEAVGEQSRGMFLAVNGVTTNRLPSAGQRFVEAFARTQPGVEVEQFAVYAAQVTETLLDAIARSDGTRESVLRELFRTHDPDGLIGEVAFDARGDIRQAGVTITRVVGGGTATGIASLAGSVVERVIPVTPGGRG